MNVERFRESEQLVNAWDRNRKLTKTSISKTLLFNAAVELDVAAFKKTSVLNNSTWSRGKKILCLETIIRIFKILSSWIEPAVAGFGGEDINIKWNEVFYSASHSSTCEIGEGAISWKWVTLTFVLKEICLIVRISGTRVTRYSNSSAKIYCFPASLKFSFESQLSPNFLELHMDEVHNLGMTNFHFHFECHHIHNFHNHHH